MKLSTASSFSVFPVPCLSDNYAYILQISSSSGSGITTTFVIDPVEPTKILPQLSTEPFAILTTHHHSDHAGGNAEMMKLVPGIQVFGGDERIASMSGVSNKLKLVHHGDVVWTNDDSSLDITALHTPCHTSGHICYYVYDKISKRGCVFTGDTLFVGGEDDHALIITDP